MQKVFLLCGVPGSGKTWVASQLKEKFTYVPNDDFIGQDYTKEVYRAARASEKPIIADCPFAERTVRETLLNMKLDVIPIFIVEDAQVIKRRYESREGKPCPSSHLTRALNIRGRAVQWAAAYGTSSEILEHLKGL